MSAHRGDFPVRRAKNGAGTDTGVERTKDVGNARRFQIDREWNIVTSATNSFVLNAKRATTNFWVVASNAILIGNVITSIENP